MLPPCESVWAEKLSSGNFSIKNIPFYAKGISLDQDLGQQILIKRELQYVIEPVEKLEGVFSFVE